MTTLKDNFVLLKQKSNSITNNPLLNSFDQKKLEQLDNEATSDIFINNKKSKILYLIRDIGIDFDSKLKSAYDEYSEALAYLMLKSKFPTVDRVPEKQGENTPDFKIEFSCDNNCETQNCVIYAELKSMSFADGNLNYMRAMEQSLEAKIDIERQLKQGHKIAFGTFEIQPLFKDNNKYSVYSTRYPIETLINKLEQNIKQGQYLLGDTVLIVDLKQLSLPSYFKEGAVPIFQEKKYNSNMSGVQWNVAFGKVGHLIFKQIEFEGKENTDGELEKNGILINYDYIKAIVFLDYALSDKEPKIIGLHKQGNISECIERFLHKFCDFVNDDKNTNGWSINEIAEE